MGRKERRQQKHKSTSSVRRPSKTKPWVFVLMALSVLAFLFLYILANSRY